MESLALSGLNILVLEDEPLLRKQAASFLERMGADVTAVDTLEKARSAIENVGFDFALLDINVPDGRGVDLLKIKNFTETTGVIIMTAQGGIQGAVEAMQLGALDYLTKPFDLAELPLLIGRVRKAKQSERIEEHRKRDETDSFVFDLSLAPLESQLQKILAADRRLQNSLPPVLIQGETGTGKTAIARWIHKQGPRAQAPFIEVNCSALPETLAESELFGHERGAFTDARAARIGLFEAAQGGSLFLDELPSLSAALQGKVLTAIDNRRIRRVGATKEVAIDARIIAATNRELPALVAKGQFREDLYHRLDLYRVAIPALRQRGDDIVKLAEMFLARLAQRHRVTGKRISAQGRQNLLSYAWPGNVRELAHEIERALVFEEGTELDFHHLAATRTQVPAGGTAAGGWFNESFVYPPAGFSLEEAIQRLISHALKQTNDNVSAAARLLGVSRDYVRYRMMGQKEATKESAISLGEISR
jgi:two-component system response regulator AtoC